ncbi:hypothetical protein DPMN_173301 [Dreissena polymorpha]|uniref:DUF6589 domain-containing protein n=1 Tax=Dreissena polymorpha TaxID=45954 RepID=A0A9D4E3U6_DREPO|nr:hypothetical protein DPMN_173301 [Dreissena polymorpha]
MDQISGHFNNELIDAIASGKKFRIVGDNINFHVGLTHERKSRGNAAHMEHWFGSMAIIQNLSFSHLSHHTPRCDLRALPVSVFLLEEKDIQILKKNISQLISRVMTEFFPWMKFAKETANKPILGEFAEFPEFRRKNQVIPLPVMSKNEQKYSDVVEILDSYENLVKSVCNQAKVEAMEVHIGGDQLTRERFSGAKRLRAAALTEMERFHHLTPITFELFHLQMSVLTLFYQQLYNTTNTEPFTLHAQKIRMLRTDADGNDVKNHYNHCKELAVSFIKSYIIEAACEQFGINDYNTVPDIHLPNDDDSVSSWLLEVVQPVTEKILDACKLDSDLDHGYCDKASDYANLVLQLGVLFMELNDVVKYPDRDRLLAVLKILMVILKGHNTRSKYALEILRLLCQQFALLSESQAYSSLYGMFVNTGGKLDTNSPADLEMEHLVRLTKGHLKAMCSNKSESSVRKRSCAFYGMKKICDNFDEQTKVVHRAQRHKVLSSVEDEKAIIKDLRKVRPFQHVCGRQIASMKHCPKNPVKKINTEELHKWISQNQIKFYYEIGR